MAEDEQERKTPVPSFIKSRVRSYLDTCDAMTKLRFRGLVVLAVMIPVLFWAQGHDFLLLAFESAGVWAFLALLSAFVNFELRQMKARALAQKIDTHIPRDHVSRDNVIAWIEAHDAGRARDVLLTKLGTAGGVESTAARIDRRFGDFLQQLGVGASGSRQTQTYTYSTTQVLRNGKWETVHESASGDGPPPEEAIQEALERMTGDQGEDTGAKPPEGFEPIPISPDPAHEEDRKRNRKRWGRAKRHMPLEIDSYQPEDEAAGSDDAGRTE